MRFFCITILLLITGCHPIHDESNCEEEVILSKTSADGQILATATRRSCGSTTSITKIIYLQKFNAKNKEKFGEKIFVSAKEVDPEFSWKDKTLLIRSQRNRNDIFLSRSNWQGVDIIYGP